MSNAIIDEVDVDVAVYQEVGVEHVSPTSGEKTYTPVVDDSIKPVEGMIFDSLDAAYAFYQRYALAGGFSVRKSADYNPKGIVKTKYYVCSKEGFKTFKPVDTLDENYKEKWVRRVPSKRTGCRAQIRLKINTEGKYRVYYVKEDHNHTFVDQEDVQFISAARGLTVVQQQLIKDLGHLNIGPVRAFNVMSTVYGGFDKVGATKSDCKNFKKDINLEIGEFDAEMVVKRLLRRRDHLPNFTCEYVTAEDGTLKCLFWADEDSKRNYYTFGDVVSFDATYRRNKYDMMFVPFTGIDNHNCNVTLGAAIIGSETAETYSWLLTMFKKAFGYEPPVIVTDQDPAMRRAILDVCPNSRHRLCMWHVMDKLTAKVGSKICNTTDFKKKLCRIVWTDAIMPEEFEKEWSSIMDEFKLQDHEWLCSIYAIRESWIPAYYRNEQMSGLMRTSSRSESENHFFGNFCNPKCTLMDFISHFDTAIEMQRYEHRKNDHDTRYTRPDIWSDFVLEKQAAEIYTRTIFFDVQLEIQAAIHSCTNVKIEPAGDFLKFFVKDWNQPCSSLFQVLIRNEDMTLKCSCNRFEQFGLLCCHIFHVLRLGDIREFPKQYILRRWTREAVPNSSPGAFYRQEGECDRNDDVNTVVREVTYATEYVINRIVTDFQELCNFRDYIKGYMSRADEVRINVPPKSKRDRFAELTGTSRPSKVTIRVPVGTRFKGSGVRKRMMSQREQAISQAGKKKRQCQKCKEYGHNSRSCQNNNTTSEVDNVGDSSEDGELDDTRVDE